MAKTEEKPEKTEEKPTEEPKDDQRAPTLGDIRGIVQEVIKAVGGLGEGVKKEEEKQQGEAEKRTETRLDRNSSIAEEVKREIQKIRDDEARQKKDQDVTTSLQELKDAVKPKQPVERRRVHKLMKWGENE